MPTTLQDTTTEMLSVTQAVYQDIIDTDGEPQCRFTIFREGEPMVSVGTTIVNDDHERDFTRALVKLARACRADGLVLAITTAFLAGDDINGVHPNDNPAASSGVLISCLGGTYCYSSMLPFGMHDDGSVCVRDLIPGVILEKRGIPDILVTMVKALDTVTPGKPNTAKAERAIHEIEAVTERYRKIWEKQPGIC